MGVSLFQTMRVALPIWKLPIVSALVIFDLEAYLLQDIVVHQISLIELTLLKYTLLGYLFDIKCFIRPEIHSSKTTTMIQKNITKQM
jgi:hypothetical protein